MSLSQEPALSNLKEYFVCGVRDISRESYAGVSGKHEPDGKAIKTTNGAGPHNLQLFMLSSDGTVLNCLPGYWSPSDLVREMNLAWQLDKVWKNNAYSRGQKDQIFRQMQLAHVNEHPPEMVRRSQMQGFDKQYEARKRLNTSDCIANTQLAAQCIPMGGKAPPEAFKTTDVIFHERMSARPFQQYNHFDVVAFSDYGRPKYDKHEDARNEYGEINKELAKNEELIGNTSAMRKGKQGNGMMGRAMNRGMKRILRQGMRAAI